VNQDLVCSSCEEEFDAADARGKPWLICPYCGARTPNPAAQIPDPSPAPVVVGCGCLYLLLAIFGGMGAMLALTGGASTVFLGCLAAMMAGIFLLRSDYLSRYPAADVASRALLLSLLGFFALLSAVGFFFGACFR
jgi:hypothetical protein